MSSPAEHEDSDDLPQRGEGEPDFLAEIYDAYGVRLYRAAARLLGVADAEDVVQELFVALARKITGSGASSGVPVCVASAARGPRA